MHYFALTRVQLDRGEPTVRTTRTCGQLDSDMHYFVHYFATAGRRHC